MGMDTATGTSVVGWQTLYTTSNTSYNVSFIALQIDAQAKGLENEVVGHFSYELSGSWVTSPYTNNWCQALHRNILGGGLRHGYPIEGYPAASSYAGEGAFYRVRVKWRYSGLAWRLHLYNTP